MQGEMEVLNSLKRTHFLHEVRVCRDADEDEANKLIKPN